MTETKTNLERKIDLLIGVIEDLKEKVDGFLGRKPRESESGLLNFDGVCT